MSNNLAFRQAQQHVDIFERETEGIVNDSNEALECYDCDDLLQVGIDAYEWMVRTDELFHLGVAQGKIEYTSAVQSAIEQGFIRWLSSTNQINDWIKVQLARGFELDNLDEFRECEQEVRAIVENIDGIEMTDAMRELRNKAIEEHRDGKTAEFI